ncbi:LOW QUALITY PROTEIN: hypothetical protein IFM46972_11363 [Aspergillus udagawae]|uniref:Uncharacterized protein n=1 Tax=Aspergillus udagawae TaxID=91492 RepID=A0A8H3SGA8_9EURO|nr:LOW QUALITY PROTEIN: hypothetical protein IFM46972_11363 [Aspergillus udagawae]
MFTNGDFINSKLLLDTSESTYILFELRRINHWLEDAKKPIADEKGDTSICLRTVYVYFKRENMGHYEWAFLNSKRRSWSLPKLVPTAFFSG